MNKFNTIKLRTVLFITVTQIFLCFQTITSQTDTKNFIKTEEVFRPVTDEGMIDGYSNTTNDKRITVEYFDGLGRPIQTVIIQKSPDLNDIIQHFEYDLLGRMPMSYLPFTKNGNNGAFVSDAQHIQATFYSQGTNPDIPVTYFPYNEIRFEQSPLNRVLETASPGESWIMETGHTIKSHIGTNETEEVKKWGVGGDGNIIPSGSYAAGKLIKNIVFDEDSNQSITYTSTQGLIVLKRQILDGQELNTYYVYNDLNLLVCVIMPNANTSGSTFDVANAFRYKYDGRRRMVEKYLPGTEPTYYVYNKANQLVFEQDGNLRLNRIWKYYKYDVLGRTIIEGSYGRDITRSNLQTELNNYNGRLYEVKDNNNNDFYHYHGYSNEALPDVLSCYMNSTYYFDSYDFNADGNAINEFNQNYKAMDGFLATIDKTPYGQITGKMNGFVVIEVFFYDMESRLIQTKTENYYTTNKYYFNGMPNKTNNKYFISPTNEFSYTFEFGYDHDWRPTNTSISINNGTSQLLNTMKYTELSALKTKFLHGNSTTFLQKQQYAYNIRGWLTQINNIDAVGTDVFAEKLFYESLPAYYNSHATACYNGNISGMEWYTKDMVSIGAVNGYALGYDGLSRLTGSSFFNRIGSTASWQDNQAPSSSNYGTITGIGSESGITYDKNGNIISLVRKGKRGSEVVKFDSFTYEYVDGTSNKLKRVTDVILGQNSLGDFVNTSAGDNIYDLNGNLTTDINRNMTLSYNNENLPTSIQFSGGRIVNTYRADGVKTTKAVYDASNRQTLNERYYGDLVLSNNVPARILHADGVIELNSTMQATYYYHLKDHLGNVRAVVSPGFNNTTAINQTNEYYPFGMVYTKTGGSLLDAVKPNKYKYNGKEEQEMPGKWLDYGARFYDTQLGRFHTQDRFSEKYMGLTAYHYTANNPLKFIDINGDSVVVLNAPSGAGGAGHMAILIQNKESEWSLYSKNGTDDNGGISGENNGNDGNDAGTKSWKSPEAFMKSDKNPIDDKTGEREYTEGYLIPATPKEDRAAEKGALKELDKDYNVAGSNCAKTVQSGLNGAGKQDGSPSFMSTAAAGTVGAVVAGPLGAAVAAKINEKTPRLIYERIKDQNQGKVIK